MLDDEVKFVTGASLNSIVTDIRRDLHWERISAHRWRDENDQTITYLHDAQQLRGIRRSRVYLLPGYDERDNWWELHDMMHERGTEIEFIG